MSTVTLIGRAWCQGCDWTAGPEKPAVVDKAAEKHTRNMGHPTECSSRPKEKA